MSYHRLIRDHEAIDALIEALVDLHRGAADPAGAVRVMEQLTVTVRDHGALEADTLAATLDAAARDRHHAAAAAAMRDVVAWREDWTMYLYRWTGTAIAADWQRFGVETAVMMERMRARVATETGILYSLALHYDLIAPA
ncbi:hypothetical protein AB5I41_25830 [Sphingomonas sp. MMS24-JH45]